MSEPTQESRDAAAQAAGFADWDQADTCGLERTNKSITAHARTLDKLHGRTPVDPLVLEAREILAKCIDGLADEYLNGARDDRPDINIVITALRRGMELAKEQSA